MKKVYLLFITLNSLNLVLAQNQPCVIADSNLIYAYSNVKDSYESNNIQHLKYYANKSLKSFEEAKTNIKKCGCDAAFEMIYNAKDFLLKADKSDTFEDARYFIKKVKEITQNTITELNKCTVPTALNSEKDSNNTVLTDNDDLKKLQLERDKLAQQQQGLKQKEEELLKKLEAEKNKEERLKKIALIKKQKDLLNVSITTYNNSLLSFGSPYKIPNYSNTDEQLITETEQYILTFYLDLTKRINTEYTDNLNKCKIN